MLDLHKQWFQSSVEVAYVAAHSRMNAEAQELGCCKQTSSASPALVPSLPLL